MNIKRPVFSATLILGMAANSAYAVFIPYGLQSDVTQATVDSWGWTEIHRSAGTSLQSEAAIVAAATGNYLMMGVWDTVTQRYAILGAGETTAVSAITYNHYNDDNNENYNPNWSNGLNWYRTESQGSWGFTTIGQTELNSADIFLLNGLQSQNGNTEGSLAAGLSFHTSGGNLTSGWAYNATGDNWQSIYENRQRVFFTVDSNVPDSGATLMLLGLALAGVAAGRRFAG